MALRVLVLQHAEKEPLPGDPGLSDAGHAQAEAAARWLAIEATPTSVWSSPMRRARETADHLAAHVGSTVLIDLRLRERMNWTGADPIEEFLDDWKRASTDRSYQPRTGDSSQGAADRFLEALNAIAGQHRDCTVVVVAHGGVTTDALRTLLGDAELFTRAPQILDVGVPGCAITALSTHGNEWTVDSIASTDHVPPAHGHPA